MMSKMGCSCGSELRTGSSTPDVEARIRKSAALKIRARPSLSSTFGPTITVPIGTVGPRSICSLADLGRPDGRPVWLSCAAPLQSQSANRHPALRLVVFHTLLRGGRPPDCRRVMRPSHKLNESSLQSNGQTAYTIRYTRNLV